MSTTTSIPVTVTPEAAAYVAELGLQKEFEQMLEHARLTIPGLLSLRADYNTGYNVDPPYIDIQATVSDYEAAQEADDAWGLWHITAFPPQVGLNFALYTTEEPENAREGIP